MKKLVNHYCEFPLKLNMFPYTKEANSEITSIYFIILKN